MIGLHPFAVALIALCLFADASAYAQEARNTANADAASSEGILSLLPDDRTTHHILRTSEGELPYTATAGTISIHGRNGRITARIFFTSYMLDGAPADRPLTFAFNGGPGASSAYLHMGMAGPRIVEVGPEGDDGTTPVLSDNPHSWLAFTDLVFIDPIGTGWSRAENDNAASAFWGVRQDAESLARFIMLFIDQKNRLASPKYLLGESYGGYRAAKVATTLRNTHGLLVSGIVMVSPMIEGRFLPRAAPDPVRAALQLPSLAAAELERTGQFSPEAVEEAERFALDEYLAALIGPAPRGEEGRNFYRRVAAMTGLPADRVERSRGYVGRHYSTESADGFVSSYDAAQTAAEAYPAGDHGYNDDPILDGYTRAYGPVFANYARQELGYLTPVSYLLLNNEVNRHWDWPGGRTAASASGDLVDLLSVIPSFRVAILHGYSDVLTPYRVSQYIVDQMPLPLTEGRIWLGTYRGGHMFYTNPASRNEAARDARSFYEAAIN